MANLDNMKCQSVFSQHSHDSSAGWTGFDSQHRQEFFSSPQCPDNSEVHLTSYLLGTRGSFPGGKVARMWSWPLTCLISRL